MKTGWNTKKILSFVLAFCMLAGLMPGAALAAEAEDLPKGAAEIAEIPEIEAVPEIEAPAEAAEPEALPEPAAEQEADGETFTVSYYTYNGESLNSGITTVSFSHAAGDTVSVSECTKTPSRSPSNYRWQENVRYQYVFDGWTLTQGTSVNEHAGDVYPLDYPLGSTFEMPAKDVKLYAHYQILDYYHWNITVGEGGTVEHGLNSSSDAYITLSSSSEAYKVYPTSLYTNGGYNVVGTVYRSFTPQPEDGYIFDGWYCNGDKLDVETLNAGSFPTLTPAMYNAGQNVIEARFMENDGTYAQVIYQDYRVYGNYTYDTVFYKHWATVGDPMPTIDDPKVDNYYFLGWDKAIPDTVPADGITLTAQWLAGPSTTLENTATPLYTILCESEGICHDDATQGMYWADSNKDIAYDETNNRYTCSITLSRIGTYIGVGPNSYDVQTGLEHKLKIANPVVNLVWNETDGQWQPVDDTQFVYVYHEDGSEGIPDSVLAAMSPIICVTDVSNSDNYVAVKLIDKTYKIVMLTTTGNTRTAKVVITDFEPYAQQLGTSYVPDWDSNLTDHVPDYYEFYLTKSYGQRHTADGHTYMAWSAWGYDKINTTLQSTGGVKHNETLYGKELLVTLPTYTLTFKDPQGFLPEQIFMVKGGQQYPTYNWTAEGVDPDIAAAAQNGNPVKISETWYSFDGWDGYPFAGFGKVPTVSGDETFTAAWTELKAITFTDGTYNGSVFEPIEFPLRDGDPLPWAEYRDLSEFENSLVPGLYEMQTEDGSVFMGWDPDLLDYALEYTSLADSVTFKAIWGKIVTVIYRDGVDGEAFGESDPFEYYMGLDEALPGFRVFDEEGNEISEPIYEGYTFVDWVSVEHEAATYTLKDELTGYTVNAFVEDGFTEFVIFLDARWEPNAIDENLKFASRSITLQNNLQVNYKVKKSVIDDGGYTDPYVVFNMDGTEVTVTGALDSANAYYVFSFRNIAPHRINDSFTATLYANLDGELHKGVTLSYSISQYCYNQLNKQSANSEFATLLVDLLNYGTQSQLYTGHNAENLANAQLTTEQAAWGTSADPTYTTVQDTQYETVEAPSVTWTALGLYLEDTVSIRLKLAVADTTGLTIRVRDDKGHTWSYDASALKATGDQYYFYFSGLNADQMREAVYITAYRNDAAVSNTVRYSVESYCYAKAGAEDALSQLLNAMMKYGDSAYNYAH